MKRRKIVVVEDEENILEVIAYNLTREGYKVLRATDGEQGLQLIRRERPDLVLLDLMLPGMDGIEVCQRLRSDQLLSDILVIMVTAKSEETDVVLGLGVGADDYIAKPFSPRELVARVRAVLRRGPRQDRDAAGARLVFEHLVIDAARHEVLLEGQPVELTPAEFRLLRHLATSPGRVYTREELLQVIGGDETLILERNIDAHVKMVRRKLGAHRGLIETIRGVGYRFNEQGES